MSLSAELFTWGTGHNANKVSPVTNITAITPITPQAEGNVQFQIDGQYAIEQIVYEGMYSDLISACLALTPGTYVSSILSTGIACQGGVLSATVDRLPAGHGKATLVLYKWNDVAPTSPTYPAETGKPSEGKSPIAAYYSMQNTRYDIPLARYLAVGTASDTYPDPYEFHKWENEPDDTLKKAYKYTDSTTAQVVDLSTKTAAYAKKITEGKEVVLRFWPVVTRTSLWWTDCIPMSTIPSASTNNAQRLGYICAPAVYAGVGTSWLKIQDDLTGEGPVKTRTECWMASEKWDLEMYGWGTDRWPFGGDADETAPSA